MLDPELNFDDCLERVNSGEGLEHHQEELVTQRESIEFIDELLRAFAVARSPFLKRGLLMMEQIIPFSADNPAQWERTAWVFDAEGKGRLNEQYHWLVGAALRRAAGPFQAILQEPDYNRDDWEEKSSRHYFNKVQEEVLIAIRELTANAAEHPLPEVLADLWISSRGLLVSAVQASPFEIHRIYAEKMALPPDLDPSGNPIARPRYWHRFADQEASGNLGFIRGNGLWRFSTLPHVQVNTVLIPGDNQTRVFLYSEKPFKT